MFYIVYMHEVNIRNIDLNLLVALEALLNEVSVTRAAMAVNLSQPAMSRALDRLRATLKDPLLVRSGRAMVLTPRAESLRTPLHDALERVRSVMSPNEFNPATSQECFRLVGVDYVSHLILPSLLEEIYTQAPHVTVEVEQLSAMAMEDLKTGKIDLGFGVLNDGPAFDQAYAQPLFEDHFVCLLRKRHALAGKKISLEDFVACSHALLSITGRGGGEIDRRLAQVGLSRKIALRLSHFTAIHSVIATTNLITTIPSRLAYQVKGHDLAVLDLPDELQGPGFTISQIWHERFHNDPARKWLRALVKNVCKNCTRINPPVEDPL